MAISPITNSVVHDAEKEYRATGQMPKVGDEYWDGLLGNLRIK